MPSYIILIMLRRLLTRFNLRHLLEISNKHSQQASLHSSIYLSQLTLVNRAQVCQLTHANRHHFSQLMD